MIARYLTRFQTQPWFAKLEFPPNGCIFMKSWSREVEGMRVIITLACTSCKQRNYTSSKNKRTHADRIELKKFCKFCNEHTPHRETR